jgi:hypothetical protein
MSPIIHTPIKLRSHESPLDRFFRIAERKIKGAGPESKQFLEFEKLVIFLEGENEFSMVELEVRLYLIGMSPSESSETLEMG